jgi:hypothetical protein
MTRSTELAFALILIPVSAFCLWDFSFVTGGITSAIALALAVGLYMHADRRA